MTSDHNSAADIMPMSAADALTTAVVDRSGTIRLFHVNIPEAALVDLRHASRQPSAPTRQPSLIDPMACSWRNSSRSFKLGDGLRLAESGGEAECLATVCDIALSILSLWKPFISALDHG